MSLNTAASEARSTRSDHEAALVATELTVTVATVHEDVGAIVTWITAVSGAGAASAAAVVKRAAVRPKELRVLCAHVRVVVALQRPSVRSIVTVVVVSPPLYRMARVAVYSHKLTILTFSSGTIQASATSHIRTISGRMSRHSTLDLTAGRDLGEGRSESNSTTRPRLTLFTSPDK